MNAPRKRKASAGGREAFQNTSNSAKNKAISSYKQRLKRLVVGLALRGLLPFALADFLIQRMGLKHE